jgi:methyltransferase (TIGR00027 family)
MGVTVMRAAHQLIDGGTILDDPIAQRLVDPDVLVKIRESPGLLEEPAAVEFRRHIALRSRCAEERLQMAVARGIGTLVILGAGFDTFAYRLPHWANGLSIYEFDAPGTQAEKLRRLHAAGIAIPEAVRFVAVNFEQTTVTEALSAAGIDTIRPAFFSWLGVTMYLTEPAIDAMLAAVAGYARTSELVLSFARPRLLPSGVELRARALGEPWKTFFTPAQIERKLRSAGFSRIEFPTETIAAAIL